MIAKLHSKSDKAKVMAAKPKLKNIRQFRDIYIHSDQSLEERRIAGNFKTIIDAVNRGENCRFMAHVWCLCTIIFLLETVLQEVEIVVILTIQITQTMFPALNRQVKTHVSQVVIIGTLLITDVAVVVMGVVGVLEVGTRLQPGFGM